MGDQFSKQDKDFYSKISNLRKKKSGGKSFVDPERAKEMQKRSIEARRRNKVERENAEKAQNS